MRNEKDGSVTVFVQGEAGLVKQLLEKIREPALVPWRKSLRITKESFEPWLARAATM